MNNKELVSSGKMTETLIGNYLLIGIPFGIISSVLRHLITSMISSNILIIILSVVLQTVLLLVLWKICVSTAFSKKTILHNDIQKVIKNLLIFTIITSVLLIAYNFFETKNNFEENLESNFEITYYENFIYKMYSDEQIAEYELQKQEAITEAKNTLYTTFIILEIALTTINFCVLIFVKKEIISRVG